MSRSTRIVLLLLAALSVVVVAAVGVATAAVYRAGRIDVDVATDGGGVQLALPAVLADIALAVVPTGVVRRAAIDASRDTPVDAAQWLPAVVAAIEALDAAGDARLLEVRSSDAHVVVEQRGRRLLLNIDADDGTRVRLALPLRTVRRLLDRIET